MKQLCPEIWILLLVIVLPLPISAVTIHVPSDDYPTIQTGIDAATDGDTVLLASGTYTGEGNKNVDIIVVG